MHPSRLSFQLSWELEGSKCQKLERCFLMCCQQDHCSRRQFDFHPPLLSLPQCAFGPVCALLTVELPGCSWIQRFPSAMWQATGEEALRLKFKIAGLFAAATWLGLDSLRPLDLQVFKVSQFIRQNRYIQMIKLGFPQSIINKLQYQKLTLFTV
ncbi:hypothetical protein FGO68_gene12887 [Halteria grandinella]|uniref:Uncharacterized protein n=1 Tax=Halteria grandinella TaxID=5974 RepID=A0A8J8NGS8_HALGN|nr:hypothetical protein FGO68_gene12887 [Halteria grandinella]